MSNCLLARFAIAGVSVGGLTGTSCSPEVSRADTPVPQYAAVANVHPEGLERLSATAAAEARYRRERILEEIEALPESSWAGTYSFGDGLCVNASLVIAPKSGFVFEWVGCLGCYDRNWGDVVEQDDALHLRFRYSNDRERGVGCAPVLLPMHRGEFRYLVEPSKIEEWKQDRSEFTFVGYTRR